ncbi:hypothetical protein PN480_03285 [Dolichospermum circinale CS-1225]|uniref:Uncharacterized protein n=1 Tax=Dolichospermum circinale CS-537/01 TaxID=3021739 RepID=A0ABT5A795_9CYAN|nr:hypothetical protein [Dolichospermum circinale]MDB9487553.1 hypothetical protein [Dolichospermum circinale CS-537/01]MDB9520979.1 hypothetical protein [Dolichospermum circinale CS-1225]
MSQNNQNTEQQQLPKILELMAIEQTLSLVVDLVFPIAMTAILAYINVQIKNIIPYVKDKISSFDKRSTPRLTIEQQTKINEYLRYILNHSYVSRVGLYWLNNPKIEDDNDIMADSYSLWIEASDTEEYNSVNLSFGYVSLQLNTMRQSNTDFAFYKDAVSGLICQVWLRHRKTKSYGIYKIGDIGFIFLEQSKATFFKRLGYRLSRKYDPNYLEYCDRIRKIIFKN